MSRQLLAIVLIGVAFATGVRPRQSPAAAASDAQALQRMVATERAFAAATAEIGVRDGFLTFFAADAVQIVPGRTGADTTLGAAPALIAARPLPALPLPSRLMWEPFTGHVSSDGTMGWLTGGYAALDQNLKIIVAQGAYFSVWKRQPDGTWKVWLDEGIALPDVWKDAAPFRVAPEPDAATDAGSAVESVADAERMIAAGDTAWRTRLAAGVRLHRDGLMPIVGRDAVAAWAETARSAVTYVPVRIEVAASGDLAVVIGGYDATARGGAEHGTFVRVWKRNATGRWRIVFETSKKHG